MRQQSVFRKIGLWFLVAYSIYSAMTFVYFVSLSSDKLDRKRLDSISNYAAFGQILLHNNQIDDLIQRMDVGIETDDIHYYLLKKNGETLLYANKAGADDPVSFVEKPQEGIYTTNSYRHFVVLENGYELSIGHKRSAKHNLLMAVNENLDLAVKDLFFVSLLVLALVLYSFRDLRALLTRIKVHGAKRGDLTLAKSAETFTLIQGMRGYESQVSRLEQQNATLKSQVLSALQRELWSGKKPPYEFGCTMARTDINNFTSIFSSKDRAIFMEQINQFFIGVTHIVSRYGGYVYEFIGDEVIFYFKDDEHENSTAIAISALRDINRLAEELNARTEAEQGYSFRVKSSLACGLLRFGPLVDGLSLAGAPLIETVRILSHIHEKSENVVLFDGAIAERISFICTTREQGVVTLKGLANARRLHVYQTHVPLSHHLIQNNAESFKLATYYRGDGDIAAILDFARLNAGVLPREDLLKLLSVLRTYRVTSYSSEIRQSYVEMIEYLAGMIDIEVRSEGESVVAEPFAIVRTYGHLGVVGHVPSSPEALHPDQHREQYVLQNASPADNTVDHASNQSMLKAWERETTARAKENSPFLLSAILAAAPHLFPPEAFTGRLREKFLRCLAASDRRIVANTIDVFGELDPGASEAVFADLMTHADNRIAANTLVKEGKRIWNKSTARRLRKLLNAQSPYYKASGLYALGEIAVHLKALDEVAFRADPLIQDLLSEIPRLAKHENKMVQRQAEGAARKSGLSPSTNSTNSESESPGVVTASSTTGEPSSKKTA